MFDYTPPSDLDTASNLSAAEAALVFRLVNEGASYHAAGRLVDAAIRYLQALDINTESPSALHLAGVATSELGQHDVAADFIRRAIDCHHDSAAFHNNLGDVLHALGRDHEAEQCYTTAIDLDPHHRIAWLNLGALRARIA
jgi:Flp pilus assembly protein TadD